jgi:hypothetical protein
MYSAFSGGKCCILLLVLIDMRSENDTNVRGCNFIEWKQMVNSWCTTHVSETETETEMILILFKF